MFYIFEIEFAKSAVERVIYMLMENRFRVLESDCLLTDTVGIQRLLRKADVGINHHVQIVCVMVTIQMEVLSAWLNRKVHLNRTVNCAIDTLANFHGFMNEKRPTTYVMSSDSVAMVPLYSRAVILIL